MEYCILEAVPVAALGVAGGVGTTGVGETVPGGAGYKHVVR